MIKLAFDTEFKITVFWFVIITWFLMLGLIFLRSKPSKEPINYYIQGYNDCQNNIVEKINKIGGLQNADSINNLVNQQFINDSINFQLNLKQ